MYCSCADGHGDVHDFVLGYHLEKKTREIKKYSYEFVFSKKLVKSIYRDYDCGDYGDGIHGTG